MGKFKKILLSSKQIEGNIKDFNQLINIFYYPKLKYYTDKIAIYFLLEKQGKEYARRSVYFNSTEQLKSLIIDLSLAYLYLQEKRTPQINPEIRLIYLDNLLYCLNQKARENWRHTGTVPK